MDLDALGWLLFQRLATEAAERELGVPASAWSGACDEVREAQVDGLPGLGREGPVGLRMAWVRRGADGRPVRVPVASDLLLTNLREDEADAAGQVLGRAWLSRAVARSGELRLGSPSVLGLQEGGPVVPAPTPSFDVAAAAVLARVFVPVRAYDRALAILRDHHFAVLTGPPEMGKTAIARTIALGLATAGWEVHECLDPADVVRAWQAGRPQVFVADDAFGSTEYRPDAGERWAREMERLLRRLDATHWMVWTSRPAPLHAGLARLHRERGAEQFPRPADVLVDAAALDRAEKALVLLRHAKAAGASGTAAARLVREHADTVVEDPHFTPERIRRFVAHRLPRLETGPQAHQEVAAAVRRELREPTAAMRESFLALDDEHRAVLVAMLDCPPGVVPERELAHAARRHAGAGLPRAPGQLMDRLADHFLRVSGPSVAWVHPSWRDLVIDQLAADRPLRQRFLHAAGLEGLLLAVSVAGGRAGERRFPLLAEDEDWDLLTDRLTRLSRDADEHDTLRVLSALEAALVATEPPDPELEAAAAAVLGALQRRWDRAAEPPSVTLLDAWYATAAVTAGAPPPPSVDRTWFAVLPPAAGELRTEDLLLAEDWLALAEVLWRHDRQALLRLGWRDQRDRLNAIGKLVQAPGQDQRRLAASASLRRRLHRLPLRGVVLPPPEWSDPAGHRGDPAPAAAGEPVAVPTWSSGTVGRILRDL